MSSKIDKSIERTLFFNVEKKPPKNCPQCKRPLALDYGPYLVATVYNQQIDEELMMNGPFGYLCPGCATAVIHIPELIEMFEDSVSDPNWDISLTFTVLGLINLDAIPPEMEHISIADLDPLPLVSFRHAPDSGKSGRQRKKRPRKPKRKRRR